MMKKRTIAIIGLVVVSVVLIGAGTKVTRNEFLKLKRQVAQLETRVKQLEKDLGYADSEYQSAKDTSTTQSKEVAPQQKQRGNISRRGITDRAQLNIKEKRIKFLSGKWEWTTNGKKVATLTLKPDMTVEWKNGKKKWELTDKSFKVDFKKGVLRATKALEKDPLTLRAIWEPSGKEKTLTGKIKKIE